MVPLSEQFSSFVITVSTGVIMGVTYDLYWSVRERLHLRKIGTGIGDLLFWSVSTAIAFFLLLIGNWGEVRFYVFIGIILGITGYLHWFSPVIRKIFNSLLLGLIKTITLIFMLVSWPFHVIRKLAMVPVGVFIIWKSWQSRQIRVVGQKLHKTIKLLFRKKGA